MKNLLVTLMKAILPLSIPASIQILSVIVLVTVWHKTYSGTLTKD